MARKRTFPCGHTGKGRFCRPCVAEQKAQEAEQVRVREETEGDQKPWRDTFADDPIPLDHLPNKNLILRARTILREIDRGVPWHQFNGKRLQHDRNVVSIPLGRRYRIVFRTDDGAPRPVEVLSHEAYNGTKPGRR